MSAVATKRGNGLMLDGLSPPAFATAGVGDAVYDATYAIPYEVEDDDVKNDLEGIRLVLAQVTEFGGPHFFVLLPFVTTGPPFNLKENRRRPEDRDRDRRRG